MKTREEKTVRMIDDTIDGWDMETLIEYAKENLGKYFKELNEEQFNQEYEKFREDFCYSEFEVQHD